MKRWKVVLVYRGNDGPQLVERQIEELEELQQIVESGPDWNALDGVHITLQRSVHDIDLTLEECEHMGALAPVLAEAYVAELKNERALVEQARGDIQNAEANGYDLSDRSSVAIAGELREMTSGYENIDQDALVEAVTKARKGIHNQNRRD